MVNSLFFIVLVGSVLFVTLAHSPNKPEARASWPLVLCGSGLLLGTWIMVYGLEWVFTEAFLVGYYCCVTNQDLPAPGTVARTISDFFRSPFGQHLPALILVGTSVAVTLYRIRQQQSFHTDVQVVLMANLAYLVVDFILVGMSWIISGWIHGPQLSAYKGFDRTWYGIVLHAGLWIAYIGVLLRITQLPWLPRNQHTPQVHISGR